MNNMKEEIICFDILSMIEHASKSNRMAGMPVPEYISMCDDTLSGIVKYDDERAFFAIAYNESELNDSLDAAEKIIVDIWKNTIVDEAYNLLHDNTEKYAASKGMYISPLYGPGYYEMPLSDMKLVCKYASAERIGISCSESGTMIPAFSRCGFFLFSETPKHENSNSCASCRGNRNGCAMCAVFYSNNNKV